MTNNTKKQESEVFKVVEKLLQGNNIFTFVLFNFLYEDFLDLYYKTKADYENLKSNKNSHSKNEELDSPEIVQREIIDMVSEQQNEQSENGVEVSGDLSNAEL